MDYVVAGFGIGAILALIGFALWELFGNVEDPGTSWLSRAAIGLMLGSLVIWAVTGVSLISHIDDSTGSHLVLLTTLVTLVAIAAGAFWYWRLDREYAAAHPRSAKVPVQREAAAPAAPLAVAGDVELTEWDSWPDREAAKNAVGSVAVLEQAETASFEPEVAVEPAVQSSSNEVAEAANSPANESADEPSDEVDDTEPADPVEVAPSNVLPFRAPAPIESDSETVAEESKDLDAEVIENDQVVAIFPVPDEPTLAAVVVKEESVDSVDDTSSDLVRETIDPIDDDPESAESAIAGETFESALLSDIDGSLATDDGGYRSPLLSDLGSDQLEGVGLAKWRPDARLTAKEGETPKSNGR